MTDQPSRPRTRLKHPPLRSKDPVDLERHRRKCQICKHPHREWIEECFIDWRRPMKTADLFGIDIDVFYRHAHAFNLFEKRKNNVRCVLEPILFRGIETQISGDTFLRALKAYTSITDNGQWVEPATNVAFSRPAPDAPALQPGVTQGVIQAPLTCETPVIDLVRVPNQLPEPPKETL